MPDTFFFFAAMALLKETVMIACLNEKILDELDLNDPFVNRFGGPPIWISPNNNKQTISLNQLPEEVLSELNCKVCKKQMLLVCQMYCVLDEVENYHRFLHIFCCLDPMCINTSQG